MKSFFATFLLSTICFIFMTMLLSAPALAVSPSDLLPPQEILTSGQRTGAEVDLPSGDFITQFVPAVVKILLGIAGAIAFITFVVAGAMLILAQENEEQTGKVKKIFMYAVIGLVLISISYALIYGVLTLSFE